MPQLAASGEERMSTILSEEKEWADEANARRAHARMIANALAVLSVVAAVAFTGTIVMLKLRKRKPKPLSGTNISAMCLRPTIPPCFRPS